MDEQVLDVEENEEELDDDELGLEEGEVGEGGGKGQELVQEAALVVQSEA